MKKPIPETDAAWVAYLEHPHCEEGDAWGLAARLERERDKLREERDMARAAANSFRQCAEITFGPMPFHGASCSAEMVERYIAAIQQEHDRWNAFREQAMDRQQFTLIARYGDVCDALKMAISQARKILLPNTEIERLREALREIRFIAVDADIKQLASEAIDKSHDPTKQ
jgi:hypothetical protein